VAAHHHLPEEGNQMTPDDLLRMPDGGMGFELIGGRLRERNASFRSSHVAGEVYSALHSFVEPRSLGWLFMSGVAYRCFPNAPDTVRRADVSFIALGRLTKEQYEAAGHCPIAPDLVGEVGSPNDLAYVLDAKVEEWLSAGVRLVWVVNPAARLVRVYDTEGPSRTLREADTLPGNGVLPGFAVSVAALFQVPGPAAPVA
jgi:Uma2 family endonuclease